MAYYLSNILIVLVFFGAHGQTINSNSLSNGDAIVQLIKNDGDTLFGFPNFKNSIFETELGDNIFKSNYPFGDINFAFWYYDQTGKSVFLKNNDLKNINKIVVLDGSCHFEKIHHESGFQYFARSIARTDENLLFSICTSNGMFFSIFNFATRKSIFEKRRIHSVNLKYDKKSYNKFIKPNFLNCPELLKYLEGNLTPENYKTSNAFHFFNGIIDLDCRTN